MRCVASSAGWKSTAAESVVTSDSAISLPMLDVPGWWENHRLPKAVAVVQALKKNGSRQARLQKLGLSRPPRHDVVDFEGDAHAQKQRQRNDVGEIQLQSDRHADFERDDDGDQERHKGQRDIP